MSWYQAGVTTPAAAAGAAFCELLAPSTTRAKVREIGVFCQSGTNSDIGLFRSAVVGTQTSPVVGQALDSIDETSVINLATTWSSAPTISTNVAHRKAFLTTSGQGYIWVFDLDELLIVPKSGSIVLWNSGGSAASALRAYFVWDE